MPSTRSQRVTVLTKYTPVRIILKDNNWYKVKGYKYTNFTGWIHKSNVTEDFSCMLIKRNPTNLYNRKKTKRKFSMHEGFKVLKKNIACNLVEDRFGKKLKLSTLKAWPRSSIKLIRF